MVDQPLLPLMQQPRQGQKFWSALIDTAPDLHRNSGTLRSRMDWNIGNSMQLSYIAGYNHFSGKTQFDQDSGVQVPTSFATGASSPNSSNTARNSAAKLDKLSLIKSDNFSVESDAGM